MAILRRGEVNLVNSRNTQLRPSLFYNFIHLRIETEAENFLKKKAYRVRQKFRSLIEISSQTNLKLYLNCQFQLFSNPITRRRFSFKVSVTIVWSSFSLDEANVQFSTFETDPKQLEDSSAIKKAIKKQLYDG